MFDDLFTVQASAVSGRRCQQHVARLSQIHRIIGTPGYGQAVQYVRAELEALGLEDVRVERFPMDGDRAYGDWIAPVAWEPHGAELWVESPQRYRLCDFAETPICLHVGSQSTPPGGLTGELIDIGGGLDPQDYADRDVRGALVLTSGNVRDVYDEAVRRRGAAGLISDNMPWQAPGIGRSPLDQPDLVSYNRLAVRSDEIGNGVFSFGISARQGARLRHLMRQGPVCVRAVVDADAHPGEMEALTASISASAEPVTGGRGPSAQDLVLLSHLCHPQPGANDNATGPALILELARSLLAGQRAGIYPPLRHTVRLLFVPEVYGTIAWLLDSQLPRVTPRLVLNLDMVGGDRAQTRGHLWLDQTPWAVPSYINDLISALLSEVQQQAPDGWRYGVREHMGGSDHILFLAPEFAIPAVMLGHEPDRFYHSNEDTVDKTSPREFEKVGQVVLATLLGVDRCTAADVRRLAYLVYTRASERIAAYAGAIMQRSVSRHGQEIGSYVTSLGVLLAKEQAALRSIVEHASGAAKATAREETERLANRLAAFCSAEVALLRETVGPATPRPHTALDGRVLRKLFRGPISSHLMGMSRFYEALGRRADFYRARSDEDRTFVRWMFEASNLMDGRRTLGEIQDRLVAEFGEEVAKVEHLHRFVDDLVSAGMVEVQ